MKLHVDLRKLVDVATASAHRTIIRVALGLNASAHASADAVDVPDTFFSLRAGSLRGVTDEQARAFLREWVLTNGFRDLAEAIASLLDGAHGVLSIWSLLPDHSKPAQILGGAWNRVMVKKRRAFARLGISKKLRELRQRGLVLDPSLVQQIESINAARNCLVHRNGVVGSEDTGAGATFVVSWTRIALVAKDEHGDRELQKHAEVSAGTMIAVRNASGSASFPVGARLSFSVQQFNEVAWTLTVFAESVRGVVEAYGRARGVRFADDREHEATGAPSPAEEEPAAASNAT